MLRLRTLLLLLIPSSALTGCDLAGGLINAGFWSAISSVVIILAVAGWTWRRFSRGRRP